MKNQNEKQDIEIAELKKDIKYLSDVLVRIDKQVSNELPHAIEKIDNDLQKHALQNTKWQIGILIGVIMMFMGVIVNLAIK